jgi:hypothetical protein
VVRICAASGLVKLGRVAVDGTKIKANASKHKAMSYGRMKEKESELRREIKEYLKRADEVDREEDQLYGADRRGDEFPEEFARRESRLKKIKEAKAALEAEAREKAAAEGKDEEKAKPTDKSQRNFTDPESKIQKTNDGFIQGYNVQVAVDEASQIIVAQHVTPTAPDVNQLIPVVESIKRTLKKKPAAILADAGYCSEENIAAMEKRGIDPYIATKRHKHGEPPLPPPRGRPEENLTLRERMARKLRGVRAKKIYSRRKVIVEPVFGQIKQARGFRQFLRRGVVNVGQEWALVSTAHNILKLLKAITAATA